MFQGAKVTPRDFIVHEATNNVYLRRATSPGLLVAYANWCGACHHFAPVANQMVQEHKLPLYSIDLADQTNLPFQDAVNQLEQKDQENKLAITGYPTLFLVSSQGRLFPFKGRDRSYQSVQSELARISN